MKQLYLPLVLIGIKFSGSVAQCPAFVNPSFENGGSCCWGCVATSWTSCTFSPDVWTGGCLFTSPLPPADGLTYGGIGSYDNGALPNNNESFGQILATPLTTGGSYSFTMAMYAMLGTTVQKGQIEIWGGSANCAKTQLLWTSPVIANTAAWTYYNVTFASPASAWSRLTFQTTCPTCNIPTTETAYVFMDDLCGSPLYVELLSFDAVAEGEKVRCGWEIAGSANNDYFAVLRSKDGINYEQIGSVTGAGNSGAAPNYEFYDGHPYAGRSYYRLRQTGYGGHSAFSGIVPVHCPDTPDVLRVLSCSREGGQISIVVDALQAVQVRVEIFNMFGQRMRCRTTGVNKGTSSIILDATNYTPGIYSVRITGPGGLRTQEKLIR